MTRFPTLVAFTALLFLIGWGGPAEAAEVSVDAHQEGEDVVIAATAVIGADATLAWRTLTDYGRYVAFVPGLRTSRVLRRDGTAATVEQTGTAAFGFLQFPIAVTYDISESPPYALRSRGVIEGVGTLESGYAIEPLGERIRLKYVGRLTTHSDLVRPIEQAAGRQTITRQFQALVDEIERVAALDRSGALAVRPRVGPMPSRRGRWSAPAPPPDQSRQKPDTPGSAVCRTRASGASLT